MVVRSPLVKAEQDRSIVIDDLTPVIMARSRLRLTEERLVPLKAFWDVAYANDRPCSFHDFSLATGLLGAFHRQFGYFNAYDSFCLRPWKLFFAVSASLFF